MKNHSYISMQQDMPDQGQLQVTVLDSASNRPVENATVRISYTGVPDNVIEEIRTDSSGKSSAAPFIVLGGERRSCAMESIISFLDRMISLFRRSELSISR